MFYRDYIYQLINGWLLVPIKGKSRAILKLKMNISEIIQEKEKKFEEKKDEKGGVQFEKQEWTEKTAEMIEKGYVFTATKMKGWSTQKMRDRYLKCQKEGEPPAALWWWLYNREKGGKEN